MTGFNGGRIPPKFSQLDRTDLQPYIEEFDGYIRTMARLTVDYQESRIRAVLEEAFVAGIGFAQGGRYDFDEWLANFITDDAPDPAEEFEALRRLGPKQSRAQWSRMQELERILDARDAASPHRPEASE